DVPHGQPCLRQSAEVTQCRPSRLGGGHAARGIRLELPFQVEPQLLLDLGLDPAASSQATEIGRQSCQHLGFLSQVERTVWIAVLSQVKRREGTRRLQAWTKIFDRSRPSRLGRAPLATGAAGRIWS